MYKYTSGSMKSPVKAWTPAKFKGFIVSLLRSGMRRFPNKSEALSKAKTTKKKNKKTNRLAQHYKCASCRKEFPLSDVQVDHIQPVVDTKQGFVDWNTFIERMYCTTENLQVICKPCHKVKSDKERKERKK